MIDYMELLETVADRIAWCIREAGGNDVTFGQAIGASKQSVGQWKNGISVPSSKLMLEIEDQYGIRALWILKGTGPRWVDEMKGQPAPERRRLPTSLDIEMELPELRPEADIELLRNMVAMWARVEPQEVIVRRGRELQPPETKLTEHAKPCTPGGTYRMYMPPKHEKSEI